LSHALVVIETNEKSTKMSSDAQSTNTTTTLIKKDDVHNTTVNPGNPVFSCDKTFTQYAPALVTEQKTRDPTSSSQHPMYVTTSNTYGLLQPTVETCPNSFHGKTQRFSEALANAGMYRNNSLNTSTDKTII
jgi:proteasome assembly chaperone 2